MTRALAVTTRQARALLKAAELERGIVEIVIGDVTVRLIPNCYAQNMLNVGAKAIGYSELSTKIDRASMRKLSPPKGRA